MTQYFPQNYHRCNSHFSLKNIYGCWSILLFALLFLDHEHPSFEWVSSTKTNQANNHLCLWRVQFLDCRLVTKQATNCWKIVKLVCLRYSRSSILVEKWLIQTFGQYFFMCCSMLEVRSSFELSPEITADWYFQDCLAFAPIIKLQINFHLVYNN